MAATPLKDADADADAARQDPDPFRRARAALAKAAAPCGGRPRPLWLDCDPGHDDAMAILLAAHLPASCRLIGVSTVACNQSLEKVTRNALDVLAAVGRGGGRVPVVAGAARPLIRAGLPAGCPDIHGDSGLDGPRGGPLLPRCGDEAEGGRPAVEAMYAAIARAAREEATAEAEAEAEAEVARAGAGAAATAGEEGAARTGQGRGRGRGRGGAPPRVALVCTAALTNAALLFSVRPECAALCEVFVMGGAVTGVGNTSPSAEFNIQTDPESLAVLLRAAEPLPPPLPPTTPAGVDAGGDPAAAPLPRPLHLTLVPLELTHTALVTPRVLGRLGCGRRPAAAAAAAGEQEEQAAAAAGAAAASPFRCMLGELLTYFAASYERTFAFEHPPLHDPCAVLAALAPSLFDLRRGRVEVSTHCPLTAGATVLDRWRQLGRPDNVTVAHGMDVAAFWEAVATAVDSADAVSPLNKK